MKAYRFLIILVVVSMVISLCGCGSSSSNKAEHVALKYVEAIFDGKAKTMANLTYDASIDESIYHTKKLYEDYLETTLEQIQKGLENKLGKKWKYSAEVVDSYEQKYINYYGTYYEYNEGYEDIDDESIEDFVVVAVKVSITGKKGILSKKTEESDNYKILTVKDGNSWKVISELDGF